VTSESVKFGAITDRLDESWEILTNADKPYPCGVVLFPVIDARPELRARHAPARIAQIVVRGRPLLRERADRPDVVSLSSGRSGIWQRSPRPA
jgi:hypothetical protein